MATPKTDLERIERLVQEKDSARGRRAIRLFLENHGSTPEKLLLSAEWFRRLGLYKDALKNLDAILPAEKEAKNDTLRQRNLLKARILNQLGASGYALKLIATLAAQTPQENRIVGDIYVANFLYAQALPFLEKSFDSEDWSYSARMARINFADGLSGSKDYARATTLAMEVLQKSAEPVLQGIALQAAGEYEARAGSFKNALKLLRQSEQTLPKDTGGVDRAFLNKWLGFCLARTGNEKQAKLYFSRAEKFLKSAHLRQEMFLDVLRLKNELGWLSRPLQKRYLCYPGLSPLLRNEFLSQAEMRFPVEIGPRQADHVFFPDSHERKIKGKTFYGLPDEERLLAFAAAAGDWGLNLNALKGLFWPEAVFEFSELDARIFQLIQRIRRKFGVHLRLDRGTVLLDETERIKVVFTGNDLPSFLHAHKAFSRQDLSTYYHCSEPKAKIILRDWLQKGWIERVGGGRTASYRIST